MAVVRTTHWFSPVILLIRRKPLLGKSAGVYYENSGRWYRSLVLLIWKPHTIPGSELWHQGRLVPRSLRLCCTFWSHASLGPWCVPSVQVPFRCLTAHERYGAILHRSHSRTGALLSLWHWPSRAGLWEKFILTHQNTDCKGCFWLLFCVSTPSNDKLN